MYDRYKAGHVVIPTAREPRKCSKVMCSGTRRRWILGEASGLCQRQGEWQVQRLRSGSEFGKFREQQGSPCSWSNEVGGGGEQIAVETQARPTAKVFSLSCSL